MPKDRKNDSTRGDAVVEATILLPIIIIIFAALMILSLVLPQRSNLQSAAQYAAAIASSIQSDTGFVYEGGHVGVELSGLKNVYTGLFRGYDGGGAVEDIIDTLSQSGIVGQNSTVTITVNEMDNYLVYKVISVEVKEVVKLPLDLSFIGLGDSVTLTARARSTVQNGDEFVRNVDIAADLTTFLTKKLGLDGSIQKMFDKVNEFFAYFNIK